MATKLTENQRLAQAGLLKVSFRTVAPDAQENAVIRATALVTHQEWREMSEAYAENPAAGFKGEYLVIPKGVTIITLRLDTPPGLV